VALGLPAGAIRVMFWIGLGLVAAAFLQFGIDVVVAAVVALVAVNAFSKGGRETLVIARDALADGARTALPVGIACALVGVIIGTMTLTGAANTFGQFIVGVGKSSLFLSLVLTMITCIVLGMGIPTIPNYIITSSIAGPALLELGVPLIVSHMFVFYFGILADLTPPVALACFAAAPIAKEKGLIISINAVKIAAAGFVIPFMAVYPGADAATRGRAGRGHRVCAGGGLYRGQDGGFHRALGRGGDRLAGSTAGLVGTGASDGGGVHAGRRPAPDR
jgi:TRAP-type uncharacterized transport system fused permease subunit